MDEDRSKYGSTKMNYFSSPKSRVIIITTTIFLIINFGAAFGLVWSFQKTGWQGWQIILILFIVFPSLILMPFLCYIYVPKGYIIAQDAIIIKRPWKNNVTIPISEVKKIWRNPAAFKGTIRVCGNGGLFGSGLVPF